MQLGVTPTDVGELLARLKARVVTVTAIAEHLVFPTLARDEDLLATPPGDRFVVIRPGRFDGIPGVVMGAGTNARAYAGRFHVNLWFRMHLDQVLRDADWLAANSGVLATWLQVLGGLEQHVPLRAADDSPLVIEPIRNDPGFSFPERPHPKDWHQLQSVWDVKFNHRLS